MSTSLPRIKATPGETSPVAGIVEWVPAKSLWVSGMYAVALVGGYLTFSGTAFLVFVVTSAVTLCLGHSLSMHRRLIHNSYDCPKWLEYLFVHFGVLVGLAGPFGMMRTHDMRDWAQLQADCHPYFAHRRPFLVDGWWQLHCDVRLTHPPAFEPEPEVANDRVYRFMERRWMPLQLPWAAVQDCNVRFCGLLTMGECWHNNHHAFPGSALLGLEKGQVDPGWWVLRALRAAGLAWNLRLPGHLPHRPELHALAIGSPLKQ